MAQAILKNTNFIAFVLLLWAMCSPHVAVPAQAATDSLQKQRYEEEKREFSMEWAAKDIASNLDFWVQARNDVDASSGTAWRVFLSRNIVSQPVAVFEVMHRTNTPVEEFCPALFIETDDYIVDQWNKEAINTLEAFIFTDPEKEGLRKECLQKIRESYIKNNK